MHTIHYQNQALLILSSLATDFTVWTHHHCFRRAMNNFLCGGKEQKQMIPPKRSEIILQAVKWWSPIIIDSINGSSTEYLITFAFDIDYLFIMKQLSGIFQILHHVYQTRFCWGPCKVNDDTASLRTASAVLGLCVSKISPICY